MKDPADSIPDADEKSFVTSIGQRLVVHTPFITENLKGEKTMLEVGTIFEVTNRTHYCWDLSLISGNGPKLLHIFNSMLLSTFKPMDNE